MEAIEKVINSPHKLEIFLVVLAAILAVQFCVKLWDYFKQRFGIETATMRRERLQSESIEALKTEFSTIKHDQAELLQNVDNLTRIVNKMQEQNNSAERARLKDRIGQSYRYYKERGCWTRMEKDAFDDLIASYEAAGGENSFVHEVCQPKSLEWDIID